MSKTRRQYSAEFKSEAVRLVRESGRSASEVANELGIGQPTLSRWVRAASSEEPAEVLDQRAEILRLKKQLKEVTQERDFLRDAAAYFASPPK